MKYLICLLVLCISLQSFSQKSTKKHDSTKHVTVIYDFFSLDPLKILRWSDKKGQEFDVRKIYFGDKVNFRIKANPFLYDVKINGFNVFDNTGLDTAFQSSFLTFFGRGSSKGQVAQTINTNTNQPQASKIPESEKRIEGLNQKLKNQRAGSVAYLRTADSLKKLKTRITDSVEKVYDDLQHQLDSIEETILNNVNLYEREKAMLEDILLYSLADYKEYDSIVAEINRYIQFRISNDNYNIDSLKRTTDFALRSWQDSVRIKSRSTFPIFLHMRQLNESYDISTFINDSIQFIAIKNRADSITKENISNFTRVYVSFLQNLNNRNFFDRTFNPEFAEADSFRFQVELKPSARAADFIKLYKLNVRDTIFKPYTIPVKRFLKLNLSVGLAFLFGNAVPYAYYYSIPKDQLADTDSVTIVRGDKKSAVIPRISLNTHLYWTNANWIKPALTIGLSTNPADPAETAYIGGISAICGQNRRMVLTVGTALANTDVLKTRFVNNMRQTKKFFSAIEEADLIEKKLTFGGFFGVSYNF